MQAIIMIKILLRRQRPHFAPYYSRTLCAILTARKDYDYQSHMVSTLEEVLEDVVMSCKPTDCIDPILTLLEAEETASGNQTTCMGLYVLGSLLHNLPQHRGTMTEEQKLRLGNLAVHCLNANDPVLRQAVVQLCLELYDLLHANFWPLVAKITEDHQSLLTYYIAKREKEGAGPIL
jgi:CLIP-associating protein 1/2